MKLKLACADFTFPLLAHDQALDVIAMLGLEGVDIGLFDGRSHLQPKEVARDISGAARELSGKLEERGLELADMFFSGGDFESFAVNHPDAEERRKTRDLFERILEFTVRCKGRHVSGLPGIHWEGERREDSLNRSSEELAWRLEKAGEAGVVFSVEAHIGSIVPTPAEAMKLVKMTPGLTLTLDYSHFTSKGMADGEVEGLIPFASHFHVRGGCGGRLQAPFKDNAIDYGRILKVMEETSYNGFLGLEYVWIDWEHCNECDNLSETILFRDFLRERMLTL